MLKRKKKWLRKLEKVQGGESLFHPGKGKGFGIEKIHTEADERHKHNH